MNTEQSPSPNPNRLREVRASRRLSQSDVAAVIKCSASRISLVENGHYDLTAEEKAAVAALLGRRVAYVFPKTKAAESKAA